VGPGDRKTARAVLGVADQVDMACVSLAVRAVEERKDKT
jgi:hypothetical protein